MDFQVFFRQDGMAGEIVFDDIADNLLAFEVFFGDQVNVAFEIYFRSVPVKLPQIRSGFVGGLTGKLRWTAGYAKR